jgi:cytochrome b involved in lipid metabolism
MGVLTVVALFLTILFLAYKYPDMFRSLLPDWITGGEQHSIATGSESGQTQKNDLASIESSATVLDTGDGESTPKAEPEEPASEVPTFTLSNNDGAEEESDPTEEPTIPMFPAANSAQRASAMAPPPRPMQNTPGLMLPPGRPTPTSTPRQSAAASLRVPSNGPLPNRGPPAGSQQRANSSLSPNGAVSTPNARGKVLLSPGHSPMDWAALTRSGNLAGVATFQRVTPSRLKTMTGRKGKPAWSSWQGKVYNITPYLPFHPGGEAELMKAAGRDGTKLFMDVHPWVNWENMLGSCLVGVMVPEDHGSGGGSLEDMD